MWMAPATNGSGTTTINTGNAADLIIGRDGTWQWLL